jgi:serine/threonine-protein kinase RsbW
MIVRPAPLSLSIASKMACVGPLGREVRAACVDLGLTERVAGEIELSVVEAVNNAIEHAYQLAEDGVVEVRLERRRSHLRVEVADRGRRLPAGALSRVRPPVVDGRDRAALPEGGMGLFILTQLMDAVRYQRRAGKNVLIMERRIDGGGR